MGGKAANYGAFEIGVHKKVLAIGVNGKNQLRTQSGTKKENIGKKQFGVKILFRHDKRLKVGAIKCSGNEWQCDLTECSAIVAHFRWASSLLNCLHSADD